MSIAQAQGCRLATSSHACYGVQKGRGGPNTPLLMDFLITPQAVPGFHMSIISYAYTDRHLVPRLVQGRTTWHLQQGRLYD